MPDLISGRVDYALLAGIVALPQVEAGKLRVLASASSSPDKGAPNIEIIGQKKVPGFDAEPWNGLMGPAGLPARSEEHTSELQSLMRISYAVYCLKKKKEN